jgi:low affinity Fe/Cu permease
MSIFARLAQGTAAWSGHAVAFMLALLVVIVWIVSGPLFGFSDTWQLVINTGTTIVTFLMVFLIQNTQNRDMMTIQLKLSELVLAMQGAENKFAALDDLSDAELEKLHEECRTNAELALKHMQARQGKQPPRGNNRKRAAAHPAATSSRKSKRAK